VVAGGGAAFFCGTIAFFTPQKNQKNSLPVIKNGRFLQF
jgi:hypothetical protein